MSQGLGKKNIVVFAKEAKEAKEAKDCADLTNNQLLINARKDHLIFYRFKNTFYAQHLACIDLQNTNYELY